MESKASPGLLTISQSPSDMPEPEELDVTMIRSLWQAFFVSRKASNNPMDRRLEYLFWRIWSSKTLQGDASIESLDRLVSQIMESSNEMLKPQPPTQTLTISPELTQPSQDLFTARGNMSHSPSKFQPTSRSKSPLPPILKKPHSVQEPKSARLLLQNPDGESVTLNPSTPPNPNSAGLNAKDSGSGRKSPKKPQANPTRAGRGSRRRPVFARRRSAQASVPKVTPPRNQRLVNSHPDAFDPLHNVDFMSPDYISQVEVQGGMSPEPEDSWADIESAEASVSVATKPRKVPLPSTSLLADRVHPPVGSPGTSLLTNRLQPLKNPEISAAVLQITDKQDPILPPGIQTVSGDPSQNGTKHDAEPTDFSFSDAFPSTTNDAIHVIPEISSGNAVETIQMGDLPSFTEAERVPMPKSMLDDMLNMIEDPTPIKGYIPLPIQPWFTAKHAWCRLPQQNYLLDWMILDDPTALNTQPSERRLVERGFRKNFDDQMREYAAFQQYMGDGLGLLDCGEPQREIWNDNWDSDSATLAVQTVDYPPSESAESE